MNDRKESATKGASLTRRAALGVGAALAGGLAAGGAVAGAEKAQDDPLVTVDFSGLRAQLTSASNRVKDWIVDHTAPFQVRLSDLATPGRVSKVLTLRNDADEPKSVEFVFGDSEVTALRAAVAPAEAAAVDVITTAVAAFNLARALNILSFDARRGTYAPTAEKLFINGAVTLAWETGLAAAAMRADATPMVTLDIADLLVNTAEGNATTPFRVPKVRPVFIPRDEFNNKDIRHSIAVAGDAQTTYRTTIPIKGLLDSDTIRQIRTAKAEPRSEGDKIRINTPVYRCFVPADFTPVRNNPEATARAAVAIHGSVALGVSVSF